MPQSDGHPRPPRWRGEGSPEAAARIQQQATWVDLQVRRAMERGEFDDLPGAGKPIEGLDAEHDPDWWLRRLVERERLVVLPPSVQLRKDDAGLDALVDEQPTEEAAREVVEEFNARVIRARYQLPQGPPLITQPRDVDTEVTRWRERRDRRQATVTPALPPTGRRRRWWRRG